MKNMLTLESFAEWAEKQPADATFYYFDMKNCACAQYATHLGVDYPCATPTSDGRFWSQAEHHAARCNTTDTFGNLAARLRQAVML